MPQNKGQRESTSKRREASRERLLWAAEEQLRIEELDEFSIDSVVERANESVGTFYRVFPNKDALLNAVQDRLHERMQPDILEAIERGSNTSRSLDEIVDHVFGVLIDRVLREKRLCRACMMLSALDPDMLRKFRQINQDRRDAVVAALATHQDQIAHADKDWAMHQAYHMYLSTIHGRLVFYGPGMRPIHGVSDESLFSQLKLSIRSFLLGNDADCPP